MKYWKRIYKPLMVGMCPPRILKFKNKWIRHTLMLLFLPISMLQNMKYFSKSKNIIPGMNLVITTKCTLKCEKCLHLIPYHKCPEDVRYEEIEKNVEKLIKVVDIIGNVTILGGEPFVHKEIDRILDLLIAQEKIRKITVTTNGTIVPKETTLKRLNNKKVFVIVSNYGQVSRNVENLAKKFDRYKVHYFTEPYHDWLDAGGMDKRGYSAKKMEEMFGCCKNAFNCASFYKSRFFSCPRELNLELLGIQEAAKETIQLEKIKSRKEMNVALKTFYSMKYTPACNYCDIGTENEKVIPCAEQLKK